MNLYPRSTRGFTLVELMIVVTLLGITALFVVPKFEAMAGLGNEDRALRLIAGSLSQAQDQALFRREEQNVVINLDEPSITTGSSGKPVALPDVEIAVELSDGQGFRREESVSIKVNEWGDVDAVKIRIGTATVVRLNPITGEFEAE